MPSADHGYIRSMHARTYSIDRRIISFSVVGVAVAVNETSPVPHAAILNKNFLIFIFETAGLLEASDSTLFIHHFALNIHIHGMPSRLNCVTIQLLCADFTIDSIRLRSNYCFRFFSLSLSLLPMQAVAAFMCLCARVRASVDVFWALLLHFLCVFIASFTRSRIWHSIDRSIRNVCVSVCCRGGAPIFSHLIQSFCVHQSSAW